MGQFDVNGFYNENESQHPSKVDKYVGLGCMGLAIVLMLLCMVVMVALSWSVAP